VTSPETEKTASPETEKFEKLELLETKIGGAVKHISKLTERCQDLKDVNETLRDEIKALQSSNNNLVQKVAQLKNESEARPKAEDRKILKRIDRMIEKFGELQI
jgi:FtsZ-binding cell division protein ZapB